MKAQTTLSEFEIGIAKPTTNAETNFDLSSWLTVLDIIELEAELKERGYRVDSSKTEVWTPDKRTFVDRDALRTAVSLGLTVEDIVEYGPRRRRKDGSAGRALNPSMMDMERIARSKGYAAFFKGLSEDYPFSRYKAKIVQKHMEQALIEELESQGLLGDAIIISGLFGDMVYLLPREKKGGAA